MSRVEVQRDVRLESVQAESRAHATTLTHCEGEGRGEEGRRREGAENLLDSKNVSNIRLWLAIMSVQGGDTYEKKGAANEEEPDVVCSPTVKRRLFEHLRVAHAARFVRASVAMSDQHTVTCRGHPLHGTVSPERLNAT